MTTTQPTRCPIDTETVLLGLLMLGHGSGVDLIERCRVRTGGRWRVGQPAVYITLKTLAWKGYIRRLTAPRWVPTGSGPPVAYALTERGTVAARERVAHVAAVFGLEDSR